ncbi:MAG: 50S ribosomal protein L10 [Anaerolinea sp.]|nr:50S ribosomal protein L10 [Anaerolinea sp.]
MAISKQQKETILTKYTEWLDQSQAVILVEYSGAKMKDLDAIRARLREAGGEFHVVKNTLARIALEKSGKSIPADYLEKSTAMGFAFSDAPAVAKSLADVIKNMDAIKVKGGYLGAKPLSAAEVKALADLPPLSVLRGQLLGILLAPASKLVRTLAEPGRQVASVLKAYSEKSATPVAA